MAQKELITKMDFATIGQEIGKEKGNEWTAAYRNAFPEAPVGYALGKNIIEKILAQPGCAGIRFDYALNDEGQKTLVYKGIDADGNDLVRHTMVRENGGIVSEEVIVADWIFVLGWPF
jgi:hypothetical protein